MMGCGVAVTMNGEGDGESEGEGVALSGGVRASVSSGSGIVGCAFTPPPYY